MLIEYCASNSMKHQLDAIRREGHEVVEYLCLDRCETCRLFAYVLADGMSVEGHDEQTVISMLQILQDMT